MNAGTPPRTACLLVPDLPRYAEQRAHPELASSAWALASHSGPRAEILSVSEEASAAGLRTTVSVAQARSICPQLEVRVASPSLQRAARQTLLDLALSVSPRAALAPPGRGLFRNQAAVFAEASGVKSLFGSERAFASALAARAEKQTLPGVVVVASSRITSLLIARQMMAHSDSQTVCVLNPEEESAFLAPLSLDLLDPDERVAQILTRLGVVCIRDLLRLPRRALTQRVGPEILQLLAQARGEEIETALPAPQSTRVEEAIDLEYPIDQMEPLGFVLRGLISRVSERLDLRGLSCGQLDLLLRLEGGAQDARRIGLAGPTLDLRVILRIVLLSLTNRPPHAAVESVTVATEGVAARSDQLDLFLPRGPDPAVLGRTLAELESLCGEGRVGMPQIARDHHPSEFELQPFSHPGPSHRGVDLHQPTPMRNQKETPPLPTCLEIRYPPCAHCVLLCEPKCKWIEVDPVSFAVPSPKEKSSRLRGPGVQRGAGGRNQSVSPLTTSTSRCQMGLSLDSALIGSSVFGKSTGSMIRPC